MNEQRISPARDDDEIDFKALGSTLRRRWLVVASVTAVGLAVALVVGGTRPPIYTATATLIPTDSTGERLASALGPLAGLAPFAPPGLIPRGDGEKLAGLLGSRVLAERVLTKNPTLTPYDPKGRAASKPLTMSEAQGLLRDGLAISSDKTTGLIEVKVKHTEPDLAAGLANAVVGELKSFLQDNSFTAAKRQREFLQKQVQDLSGEIKQIETQLIAFQEQHQLVSLDAQTNATIQTYSTLKSQLITKEMELQLQSNSVSPHDLELVGLKQEVQLLREKLAGLESGATGGLLAFKDAPRLGVQYAQFQRDLTVKQKVFELLTQQLELAKIEESRDSLSFQVIDRAAVPDTASGAERLTIWIVGGILSLALGIFFALVLDKPMGRKKRTPTRPRPKPASQRLVPIPREGL
ncbi:tyrosine kinase [compost metagenome]